MKEAWTGRLVGKMHVNDVTYEELGKEMGICKGYVAQILNGYRKPKDARKRMETALDAILERRQA